MGDNLADEEDYEIIRVHNGKSDVVDSFYDPETDTLTFETDRFSIYAIAYKKASPPTHVDHVLQTTTTKASISKNGKTETKCSVCGKVTETTVINAVKSINLSATSYTYNGKVKSPTVTVKDSNGKTIAASNYDVTYGSSRKNVGKYTVKVTFKGDYAGTVTKSFKINPKSTTISSIPQAVNSKVQKL